MSTAVPGGDTSAVLSMDEVRSSFAGAGLGAYLNTAAEGLFLRGNSAALDRYESCKARGYLGRDECVATEARCRSLVADMLRAEPADIAFVASTGRGLDAAINSVDWRPGDNIVLTDAEFPTTAFAAVHLSRRGVERRIVRARRGETPTEAFEGQIDRRTRLVVASLVSFKTGYRIDLPSLATLVHERGALLFVDAIQALGVVPVDCRGADFLCAGTFKWLLGVHGLALLYINPEPSRPIEPPYVGYRGVVDLFPPDRFDAYELQPDARRFEEGMPNFPALFVLENSLSFLRSIGPERIAAHTALLVADTMAGLDQLGIEPLTTRDPSARAGIVSFETPLAIEAAARLAASDVHVWGKDGRLRMSPYIYNDEDDVADAIDALGGLIKEGLCLQP
jgi:selenocysteine lyase/cysteine desulfurase